MSFDTTIYAGYGAEKKTGTTKYHTLGTKMELPDGRVFRYALAAGVALGAGNVIQAQAAVEGGSGDTDVTVSTRSDLGWSTVTANIPIGNTKVGIAWSSAGDHPANTYVDGYLNVESTPGFGMHRIAKDESTGGTSSTAGHSVLVLDEGDKLVAALTTVSKLSLTPNLYSSVIVTPAGVSTGIVAGVTPVDVAVNAYFWVQTRGLASVDYDAAINAVVVGGPAAVGSTIAGAIEGLSTLATTVPALVRTSQPIIGIFSTGIPTDADRATVMLTLE
jgi:hypothetical protein